MRLGWLLLLLLAPLMGCASSTAFAPSDRVVDVALSKAAAAEVDCVSHVCSDDPEEPCNQVVSFRPVICDLIEVWPEGAPEACHTVPGVQTSIDLTATACLANRKWSLFRLRSCNGSACADFSNAVEIQPTSCVENYPTGNTVCSKGGDCQPERAHCQRPCCPGSALLLPLEQYPKCPEDS